MIYRTRQKARQALVIFSCLLLLVPAASYAGNGKKHFKLGMQYELNKQWDKAAEQYALASAESPANAEYTLHLQRALVNAAIMLESRGDMLAQQKDYQAAYQAYRLGYSFDPTNEQTFVKMKRMAEAQGIREPGGAAKPGQPDKSGQKSPGVETSYSEDQQAQAETAELRAEGLGFEHDVAERYVEKRYPAQDIIYRPMSLTAAITQLAQSMRLNVVFDSITEQMLKRTSDYSVELRDMTPARALEIILDTNNLMFCPLDARTIVIAQDNQQNRMRYERQAVRTFYVVNADITEVKNALTQTINTKQVVPYKQLNALVVRDTPANLELADQIIKSLDKSKAEVLVDVNLYEIDTNDFVSLGNQIFAENSSSPNSLSFLGGLGQSTALKALATPAPAALLGPLGIGIGLPASSVAFLQSKGKSRLLASTQVHVLDGEQHTIRIGQRVPIQTASIPYYGGVTAVVTPTGTGTGTGTVTGTGTTGTGTTTGTGSAISPFGGVGGYPQIQYENVGLNIDMTPTVVNNDVQMKMKIESSSIDGSTNTLTPTFNQRQMQSVARIRDGQTTMIAGISQTNESKSVKGVPLIGLLPILGRFFATPNTNNTNNDVVITVTPHILRNADINTSDHFTRSVGPESNPKRQLTLEQILYLADHQTATDERPLAAEKDGPGKLASSPPSAQPPGARPAPATASDGPGVVTIMPTSAVSPAGTTQNRNPQFKPAPSALTPQGLPQAKKAKQADDDDDDDDDDDTSQNKTVQMLVRASPVAVRGQQFVVAVIVNGDATVTSANIAVTFDPGVFEVKGVRDGGMMSAGGVQVEPQFSASGGMLNVQLNRPPGAPGVPARGQLVYVIFDVKGTGSTAIGLSDQSSLVNATGQNLALKLSPAQVQVR